MPRPILLLSLLSATPLSLALSVIRPPVPAYLSEDWWTPQTAHEAVTELGLGLSLAGEQLSTLADECFWVTGEPDECELACETEVEGCDIAPMGTMPEQLAAAGLPEALVEDALNRLQLQEFSAEPHESEADEMRDELDLPTKALMAEEAALSTLMHECFWDDDCGI
eukprot:scaffold279742_cov33-Tisochrysis_lutea.AAC.1